MLPRFTDQGPSDGHPIVFLHGFPFDRRQWDPQAAEFSKVYRVITLDMRGHGETPVGPRPTMIEFLVDDVIELLDHLDLEKATICGLSMGGYIALRLVDRHPERVHGLVLVDTRAGADDNDGRVKRAGAARSIQEDGMEALAKKLLPALFGETGVEENTPGVASIREQILATDPEGACAALGAMASRLDLTGRLSKIETPTLVVVGANDTITPPADAQAMRDAIPGARLVEIADAGHVSNLSQPAAFNAALVEFLSELSAG